MSDCQRQATHDQHAKLANFTVPISPIEPWLALQQLEATYPIHFYYSTTNYTLLGLGITIAQQAAGCDRFERMQQFVDVWKRRILSSEQNGPVIKPYFLCGFTFFDQAANSSFSAAQVFVPQLQIVQRNGQTAVSLNYLVDDEVNITRIVDDIRQRLQTLETAAKKASSALLSQNALQTPNVVRDVGNFEQMVSGVLPALRSSKLHKVVLADALDVLSVNPFSIPASLRALSLAYGDCCIFSVSNGKGPVFIGASPERLLSIGPLGPSVNGKQLTTDALAGSAPRGDTAIKDQLIADQLLKNPKERYEHQVVVKFIVEQLIELGLNPEFGNSPNVLRLANIQHLHTPIRAVLPDHLKPLNLVKILHPTPAVAGFPRPVASQLIQTTESFDRGLYASPIGWIDANGNSEFVVGIRSALINGRQARLFAGAGIVAQSKPQSELAEVKLKLQALLGALG
ncbi:MAG: isochorismate synthase MenF [Leptolyngbyaceae cyanobacterium]